MNTRGARHCDLAPGQRFKEGFGGAAPWFPTTGVALGDFCRSNDPHPINQLVEEFFHTIQYSIMSPRQVCLYHKAYNVAVKAGLMRWDRDLKNLDEPVPTLQADEYMASALHAWLGYNTGRSGEYKATRGNVEALSGREQMRREVNAEGAARAPSDSTASC